MMSKDDDTQVDAPAFPLNASGRDCSDRNREGRRTSEQSVPEGKVPEYLARVAPVTVPPTRIQASPELLADNYLSLLESVSEKEAFGILELGRFQLGLRKRMSRELQALYAGLWNLALRRSFPHDYEEIFQTWLQREGAKLSTRRREEREERILQYVESLRQYGDTDFSELSRHITGLLETDEVRGKRISFGMALYIRRIYTYFFDHLL